MDVLKTLDAVQVDSNLYPAVNKWRSRVMSYPRETQSRYVIHSTIYLLYYYIPARAMPEMRSKFKHSSLVMLGGRFVMHAVNPSYV